MKGSQDKHWPLDFSAKVFVQNKIRVDNKPGLVLINQSPAQPEQLSYKKIKYLMKRNDVLWHQEMVTSCIKEEEYKIKTLK